MSKTFEKAPDDVKAMLVDMMRRHHPELSKASVTIDTLLAFNIDEDANENQPALKLHGYGAAAIIKVANLEARSLGRADALLTIDAYSWERLGQNERRALLDHELQHLELVVTDTGTVKRDDVRRPRLRLRLHDWNLQGFDVIAQRHGSHALEVQAIRACRGEATGQMRWDFDIASAVDLAGVPANGAESRATAAE